MKIAETENAIIRIKEATFENVISEALEEKLRQEVVETVQAIIEEALVAEVDAYLDELVEKPRKSGYYGRTVDTQYGRIEGLAVPKLRYGNQGREWQILTRYQREIRGLVDMAGHLYTMGLSLRDLQEALYFLVGKVLSRTAVNKVTCRVQTRMAEKRDAPIEKTPPIIIVDGVWVDIQYTLEDVFKVDRAGHQRQQRHAQERVILAVMAVWPDGRYHILHYEVAQAEDKTTWATCFANLIARGLDSHAVELLVSDGSKGMLMALKQHLPHTVQQRCITHKVRGMERNLTYHQLPEHDSDGNSLDTSTAKRQRWSQLKRDAYDIYDSRYAGSKRKEGLRERSSTKAA